MKSVRLSAHAREQVSYRGTTEREVIETINGSTWQASGMGRLECRKDFSYENMWNKVYYKTKQVRPIFIEEEKEVVVITVYTYFF